MTFTFPSALNYSFPISCARETKENFNFSPFYFISFLYFSPHFPFSLKISSKTFPFFSLRGKFSRSRMFRCDNNSIERNFSAPTSLDFWTVTPKLYWTFTLFSPLFNKKNSAELGKNCTFSNFLLRMIKRRERFSVFPMLFSFGAGSRKAFPVLPGITNTNPIEWSFSNSRFFQ